MLNPMTLKSVAAVQALGRVMRRLGAQDDLSDVPGEIEDGGRRVVLPRDAFVKLMAEEGVAPDDIQFRSDPAVDYVELILRKSDRATVLLPEPSVLAGLGVAASHADKVPVTMPSVYAQMITAGDLDGMTKVFRAGAAGYQLRVTDADLETFMGCYPFFQCA